MPHALTVPPVLSPQCITDWHRQNGFASSLELPDNTLNFAKKHPLMDEPVPPQRGRPLLLKKDANFTQLVVDRVAGLDGNTYEVLFIGTGNARAQGTGMGREGTETEHSGHRGQRDRGQRALRGQSTEGTGHSRDRGQRDGDRGTGGTGHRGDRAQRGQGRGDKAQRGQGAQGTGL